MPADSPSIPSQAKPSPDESIVEVANLKLRLGDHVSPKIRESIKSGEYEQGELRALRSLLEPGDVVMELGTGLGFLSAYCAQIVGSESVHTFEANSALEPHIRATFALNGVSPKLEICVLADRPGDHTFYVAEAFWESSLIPLANPVDVVKVPGRLVNDELARIKPTLLVVDIEGGEYELFQYLNPTGIRKIVIELHPEEIGLEKVKAVVSVLYGNGFRAIKDASFGNVLALARSDQTAPVPALTEADAIDRLDWTQFRRAVDELNAFIGPADGFILVDEYLFGPKAIGRRRRFFLPDCEGEYCGLPADDRSAIEELERLIREGAKFLVFAWPAFWWFEHYTGLNDHLRSRFRLLAENDRLVVFDLGRDRK